jgi:LPS export ABC transporter permease LptG
MPFNKRLIERHLIAAIVPYMVMAFFLLSGIILVQQATRYTDLLIGTVGSFYILTRTTAALLPNVFVFTIPMAVLFGTVIGFSQMSSDSEITAMRAAGIGSLSIILPVLLLGLALTLTTFYLNSVVVPGSARMMKQLLLYAAVHKLDSPVQPNSFYTEIPGYVVYVRDGDKNKGAWGRVFIFSKDPAGWARLITARSGRVDSSSVQTELVLIDTKVVKMPANFLSWGNPSQDELIDEHYQQTRLLFDTGKGALVDKLGKVKEEPDELDLPELSAYAANQQGMDRTNAVLLLHKRLSSSVAPLIFAIIGIGLGIHVKRGGRGLGLLLALATLVAYYLITLIGEQLSRADSLPLMIGPWLATLFTLSFGLLLICARKRFFVLRVFKNPTLKIARLFNFETTDGKGKRVNRFINFPSLVDVELFRGLALNLCLITTGLTAIFLIFTLFGIWKFIVQNMVGVNVVIQYLFFLLPFMMVQLLPSSLLVATLLTFAIKAKRSEIVAWYASGASIYRLLLPGLIVAIMVAGLQWSIQEHWMPQSNIKQDAIRSRIRDNGSSMAASNNRQWFASKSGKIYNYEYEGNGVLKEPIIYDFDNELVHLKNIKFGQAGFWQDERTMILTNARSVNFEELKEKGRVNGDLVLLNSETSAALKPLSDKPSQLSAQDLSDYIVKKGGFDSDNASLVVALYRKYASPFGSLVMALMGIPLAISFGRRSAITALCVAIGMGLAFLAISEALQQMGGYNKLPPVIAAWAPIIIFMALDVYLLSRTRT